MRVGVTMSSAGRGYLSLRACTLSNTRGLMVETLSGRRRAAIWPRGSCHSLNLQELQSLIMQETIREVQDDSRLFFKAMHPTPLKRIAMHALGHGAKRVRENMVYAVKSLPSDKTNWWSHLITQRPSPNSRVVGAVEVMRIGVIVDRAARPKGAHSWLSVEYFGYSPDDYRPERPMQKAYAQSKNIAHAYISQALSNRIMNWRTLANWSLG